jgi:putative transposase
MPRRARKAPGGVVFHCLNRGNDRRELFADDGDYAAFERVMEATVQAVPCASWRIA